MDTKREWVRKFATDPWTVLEDWEPFCQSEEGVNIETTYIDEKQQLPKALQQAKDKLRPSIPDERSLENPGAPFNGPRYCLRNVIKEVRRKGEQPSCMLEFGPSDYRTFLVTNGMEKKWVEYAGVQDIWQSPAQWAKRWVKDEPPSFFENSFGVNIIVTISDQDGRCYALFREREGTAVRPDTTVGSADEGIRRGYKDKLFDQKSYTDLAPDIERAAYRAAQEEVGLSAELVGESRPRLVSVGRVRSLWQPAALFHWSLDLSLGQLRHCVEIAQDRHLEFKRNGTHFVPFTREGIVQFVLDQEDHAPVETWVAAMALYSLGTRGVTQKKVFICHSSCDKSIASNLAQYLRHNGITEWLAEVEIKVGDSLLGKLAEGIKRVDYVIALLSSESLSSSWVQKELQIAMYQEVQNKQLKVLPVRLDDCILPGFIEEKKYCDLRSPNKSEAAFRELLRSIGDL